MSAADMLGVACLSVGWVLSQFLHEKKGRFPARYVSLHTEFVSSFNSYFHSVS
jgi:hypothetical protein